MGRYLSAVIVTILWMTFEQEGHCSQAAVHMGRLLVTYTGQHRASHTTGPLQLLCHSSVWHDGSFLMNVGREHREHTDLEQMSVCVLRAALRLGAAGKWVMHSAPASGCLRCAQPWAEWRRRASTWPCPHGPHSLGTDFCQYPGS